MTLINLTLDGHSVIQKSLRRTMTVDTLNQTTHILTICLCNVNFNIILCSGLIPKLLNHMSETIYGAFANVSRWPLENS
jgi:hypothetical protein